MTAKSRLYGTIKISFQMEPYLRHVQNEEHRIALTRFRCSSHHLAIETGRWRKPPIPIGERRCRLCRVVEDEYHMIVQCARYRSQRAELNNSIFSTLGDEFSTFKQNLFNNVLTSQNVKVQRALAKFLSKAPDMHENQWAIIIIIIVVVRLESLILAQRANCLRWNIWYLSYDYVLFLTCVIHHVWCVIHCETINTALRVVPCFDLSTLWNSVWVFDSI